MENVTELETATLRKVALRLMPSLTLGYFLASLDRVNVGFAALQMNDDIGLSAAAFGLGAGLFFVAYCFFSVPCNVMMVKVGARRWLSLVMVVWGVISSGMALVQGPWSFYVLRFLLGIAEAGFFPGVTYFFTLWFPKTVRGRMVAILMMALPLSSVLGSPGFRRLTVNRWHPEPAWLALAVYYRRPTGGGTRPAGAADFAARCTIRSLADGGAARLADARIDRARRGGGGGCPPGAAMASAI